MVGVWCKKTMILLHISVLLHSNKFFLSSVSLLEMKYHYSSQLFLIWRNFRVSSPSILVTVTLKLLCLFSIILNLFPRIQETTIAVIWLSRECPLPRCGQHQLTSKFRYPETSFLKHRRKKAKMIPMQSLCHKVHTHCSGSSKATLQYCQPIQLLHDQLHSILEVAY